MGWWFCYRSGELLAALSTSVQDERPIGAPQVDGSVEGGVAEGDGPAAGEGVEVDFLVEGEVLAEAEQVGAGNETARFY